jgi:hypothetical protein
MDNVWFARGAHLPLVVMNTKIPGFTDECNVFSWTVRLNLPKKELETAIYSGLVKGSLRSDLHSLNRRRRKSGATRIRCRSGLADCRHTSL